MLVTRLESLEIACPRLCKFNSKYIGNIKTVHPRARLRVANFPDWLVTLNFDYRFARTCLKMLHANSVFQSLTHWVAALSPWRVKSSGIRQSNMIKWAHCLGWGGFSVNRKKRCFLKTEILDVTFGGKPKKTKNRGKTGKNEEKSVFYWNRAILIRVWCNWITFWHNFTHEKLKRVCLKFDNVFKIPYV